MESVLVNSVGFKIVFYGIHRICKSKIALLSLLTLMIVGNIVYFLQMKNENLFQVLGVKRNFDRKTLFAVYKKTLKENPYKEEIIEKAFDTLNSQPTTVYYDKFGETPGNMIASSIIYSPAALYGKLVESLPLYLILLVVYTWRSRGEKLREARKIILAISVIILTIEINYIISDNNEADFFDKIYELAIFEKNQLLRYLLVLLLETILCYYQYFSRNSDELMDELLLAIKTNWRKVSLVSHYFDGFSKENLSKSHQSFERSFYILQKEKHQKQSDGNDLSEEEKEGTNWIMERKKKLIIIFLFILFLTIFGNSEARDWVNEMDEF